ncbi:hypothetical protein M409DRAFT_66637 [Zasmidium cellare ATCC 36951]|uniref:Cytochrome P450 n=1 Tax=Zasmidium cellare ATCC 36951 TaxID=1080233 RepID=A0A6A6CHJ2_ZASCE|nr:uncharacterized protein M409DRAFT_66637 [Zasmidium cellare ATCC 36951]KAF2166664.1 hypothetical protein M409DRAFT_66637 [Zasmidium cellare ATCC 36951]
MELFYHLLSRLMRLAAITCGLWILIRRVAQASSAFPLQSLQNDRIAIIAALVISLIGARVWEYIELAPLRKLPSFQLLDFRELLPITDTPRGKQVLEWVKKSPGADLMDIEVAGGFHTLIPLSPRAHRDIHTTRAADFEKPLFGRNYLSRLLGNGMILSEGNVHKHQRKVITPSFRIQNIISLQPLMAEKTNLMFKGIDHEMCENERIEIASWGSRVTMDIIGPAFMSKDFGSLKSPDSPMEHAYKNLVEPSSGQSLLFMLSLIFPRFIVRAIPTPTNRMLAKNIDYIRSACRAILDEKLASLKGTRPGDADETTSDILGSIIARGDFSEQDLVDQMLTFLSAGHETTASSIAWATHLLTLPQYTHFQQELRDEIREAVKIAPAFDPAQGILPYSTLEKLPLLNGICEETLRLFPPVTNTGRVAIRDTFVADTPIRKGMMLAIFPWATNRNPEFWGVTAEEMVPQRWIDEDANGARRLNKHGGAASNMCEQTFLHGNRACIGQDFAKAELRYILAALFERYHLERLEGDRGHVVPAGSLTIKPRGGLYVRGPW